MIVLAISHVYEKIDFIPQTAQRAFLFCCNIHLTYRCNLEHLLFSVSHYRHFCQATTQPSPPQLFSTSSFYDYVYEFNFVQKILPILLSNTYYEIIFVETDIRLSTFYLFFSLDTENLKLLLLLSEQTSYPLAPDLVQIVIQRSFYAF